MPLCTASATASVRLVTPNLERTLLTWNLTTDTPTASPSLKTQSPNPAAYTARLGSDRM